MQAGNLTVRQAAGKVRERGPLVPDAGAVTARRGNTARVHAVAEDALTRRDVR